MLAELTPKVGSASKASASMANPRVKAVAISPGLFAVGGDATRTYALSIVPLRQNNEGEAAAQMLAGLAALAHRNPSDETLRKVLAEVAIQG